MAKKKGERALHLFCRETERYDGSLKGKDCYASLDRPGKATDPLTGKRKRAYRVARIILPHHTLRLREGEVEG